MNLVGRSAHPPPVTVLMPVYNGARHLVEAVDSILGQTFTDFELLVIDDGSTDDSVALVQSYGDQRIRLESNGSNLGLVASLNRGLTLARGEFIARMDCDDIALPTRLARQVEFMERHPDVIVCGTWMRAFGAGRELLWEAPAGHDEIKARLLFESCLFHPTVMLRTATLRAHHLEYDDGFRHAEDYELWTRLASLGRMANLGEVLLRYRLHEDNVGLVHRPAQRATAKRVREGQLIDLGLAPNQRGIDIHEALSCWETGSGLDYLDEARQWLDNLLSANRRTCRVDEDALQREAGSRFHYACRELSVAGLGAYRRFCSSGFAATVSHPARVHWELLGRCLLRRGR